MNRVDQLRSCTSDPAGSRASGSLDISPWTSAPNYPSSPSALGRLAPYFDRLWRRSVDARGVQRAADRRGSGRPGRSFTRPPRISTIECSCRLWPTPGDVGGDLDAVGQPHTGDLAQRRVRLLRRRGVDADTDAAPLRATACSAGLLVFATCALAALADQLIESSASSCLSSMPQPAATQPDISRDDTSPSVLSGG